MTEPHGDLGLGVGAFGHRMHLVELQLRLVRHQRLDAVEHRVDRAVALGLLDLRLSLDVELHGGTLRAMGTRDHRQRTQLDPVMRRRQLLVDQRLDVLVVDVLLAVGQRLHPREGILQLVGAELVAHLLQLVDEGMASRMLAQHQRRLLEADHLRAHDLIGRGILEHAVLMDAALVRERIAADDGLVVLHRKRGRRRHDLRGAGQHRGVDLVPVGKLVVADVDRHHDFLERGVTRTLADAVDGAFHLTRAAGDSGQRIRHRHAEVVVAMDREHRLVGVRHPLHQGAHEVGVFLRNGVADGIRNVHRRRPGLDDRLDDAAQEIHFAAGAVLGRPFDVVDLVAGPGHVGDRGLDHLLRRHVELDAHVQRRGGDHGVDAAAPGELHRLGAAVDVLRMDPRQAGDDGILGAPGDLADRLEVTLGGDREAGLDDIDAHVVQQFGDLELFLEGHGGAGALLAVAQGGVEDDDAVLLGPGGCRHGKFLWSGAPG